MTELGAIATREQPGSPAQASTGDRRAETPAERAAVDRVLQDRWLRFLAMGLWLVALIIIASTLLIWAGRGFPRAPISFARGPLGTSAIALTGVVYSTVAIFLANRLPRNPIGWIFLAIGLGMAIVMPVNLSLSDALRSFRPVPTGSLFLAWAVTSVQLPASGALLVVVLLLFPSGRPVWRHFWLAASLAALGCMLMTIGSMLEPEGLLWYPSLPNPTGAPSSFMPFLVGARVVGMIALVLSLGLAASWLASRFREGDKYQRRQLGWILVGGVAMVSTLGPLFAVRYALGAPDVTGEQMVFVAAVGGVLFPITVTVAALREHLFGIEGIVTRTLIYVPLMAILGGFYTASVMLLQKVFVAFTGNPSDAAIVMATLLMAGALTPVRRSLEGLVERNTRVKGAPTPIAGGADNPALALVLERLDALEHRIDSLDGGIASEELAEARTSMTVMAMQALQLPAPGEGGLPEPIHPPSTAGSHPNARRHRNGSSLADPAHAHTGHARSGRAQPHQTQSG